MDTATKNMTVIPRSLSDAPSIIERIWPVQKISVEAQKERKAVHGQTLTGLGSYWKGRKPLVLARACVMGALLPSTGDDEKDLQIFELLVGMSDDQVAPRFKDALTVSEIDTYGTNEQKADLIEQDELGGRSVKTIPREQRAQILSRIIVRMPYQVRVDKLLRPEEVAEPDLTGPYLATINEHLGTNADSLAELLRELGIMRFGRRPRLADTFSGGGALPFEAARVGCDVFASDLNPIACMLTWGDFNLLGASSAERERIEKDQERLAKAVDRELIELGVEHDERGNRAKVFLYCLETRCPQTGWMVPMLPSRIVSAARGVIAVLVPDSKRKRFDVEIRVGVSAAELTTAAKGTVQDGRLVYSLDEETYATPIKTIRGDRKGADGESVNDLRRWEKDDFAPRKDDVFQERLYCIQWITKDTLHKKRQQTFFKAPSAADLGREQLVEEHVRKHLAAWQAEGLVSDMAIETGKENEGPIRTNGWTYWHHMFMPRAILTAALIAKHSDNQPHNAFSLLKYLDNNSKSCRWKVSQSGGDGGAVSTFDSQALKTIFNWALRSFPVVPWRLKLSASETIHGEVDIKCADARQFRDSIDLGITDPPYADAVNYHEITEFFIAWLRRRAPEPFQHWVWDSRRALAIKGDGEDFRKSMIDAYTALAANTAANGLQIVMFTHQDARVWADMAQIFWGAELQVMAAWYVATETTSELKKGGYVQGTVILVLRKRKIQENGYKDEIVQEVRSEVADQIDTMVGLNQRLKGHGRIENLFEDADLQMAGYAAALRVLTRYARIDGVDMTKEAVRPSAKGEKGLVAEVIDFAVQVANEHMVPEGMPPAVWERLTGAERFYLKMIDIETTSARKLDNYQNFAKAFRVGNYSDLMGSVEPNKARLRTAAGFKNGGFEIADFGSAPTRAVLYAIYEIENDVEGEDVLAHLRDLVPRYMTARDDLLAIANYVAKKRLGVDDAEARAAGILYGLIRNERLG